MINGYSVTRLFQSFIVVLLTAALTHAEQAPQVPSGDFTLTDANGNTHKLSDYHGKLVVLEWINFDCPFVKKHYQSGNMPGLQKHYIEKGVVWLAINSSAPDKQGHYTGDELNQRISNEHFSGTAYLLDPDGTVGKMYDAKTTPHIYIFDPELQLIYQGAIDSIRSTDPDDIPNATNHLVATLDAAIAGLPIPHAQTAPYGCSVKY